MATIKVSQLPTATSFDDDDYVMIVQSNTNKKITKENMYSNYIYSTNETVMGKWIDNKPIYRKVYSGTATNSNDINIDLSALNVETITNSYGWVKAQYGQWWPISNYYPPESNYGVSTNINLENNTFNVHCEAYYSYPDYRIIIEYTKTTD